MIERISKIKFWKSIGLERAFFMFTVLRSILQSLITDLTEHST